MLHLLNVFVIPCCCTLKSTFSSHKTRYAKAWKQLCLVVISCASLNKAENDFVTMPTTMTLFNSDNLFFLKIR